MLYEVPKNSEIHGESKMIVTTQRGEKLGVIFIIMMEGILNLVLFTDNLLKKCFKNIKLAWVGGVAQLVGTSFHAPKGCGFGSWLGHAWEQLMDVSLSSLSPLPFSLFIWDQCTYFGMEIF